MGQDVTPGHGFDDLYRRHSGRCLQVALRVTWDHHLAEDAVQDAFLDYSQHADRYNPGRGSMQNWLNTLTHRRAVDLVRRNHRQARPFEWVEHHLSGRPTEDRGPAEQAIAAAARAEVGEAVAKLNAGQQRILLLMFQAGHSESATAKALSIPLGTVKTRKSTAFRALRGSLSHLVLD